MNEEQLLKSIGLPKLTYVLRTFPYNKMESQLSTIQKKVIRENVQPRGIRILAIISPYTTKIAKYEDETVRFEEIHFYCIQLQNFKKAVDVYKVFAQTMPYPLVILFTDGKKMCWVMATHMKQKQTHLLSIDVIYTSDEMLPHNEVEKHLRFSEMDRINLKSTYYSWIEQLLQTELKWKYGISRRISIKKNILQQLKELDRQIEQLVGQAKREKQMNKRIAIQLEANKLKRAKKALIEKEQ